MPLITCPDCGREVSDRAPTCPGCGAPIAATAPVDPVAIHGRGEGLFLRSCNLGCVVLIGFFVIVFFMLAENSSQTSSPPSETRSVVSAQRYEAALDELDVSCSEGAGGMQALAMAARGEYVSATELLVGFADALPSGPPAFPCAGLFEAFVQSVR